MYKSSIWLYYIHDTTAQFNSQTIVILNGIGHYEYTCSLLKVSNVSTKSFVGKRNCMYVSFIQMLSEFYSTEYYM